jgi:predicted GNAT superfamily acetyltransferase
MDRTAPAIHIRPLRSIKELKAVEALQLEVWDCSELEVLPSLALIPLVDIGGVLLGAFDDQELIGFVVGFPGLEAGKPIIHSDMLAVKHEYRSAGVGYRLKLAQREAALANGVERITWTFDPLQSTNAHLNFAKLGVTANRYKINYYGETSSVLHSTGTDRLWVTWILSIERVDHRLVNRKPEPPDTFAELPALVRLDSHAEPILEALALKQLSLRIEIPDDINAIAATDPTRARRWREATRAAFTSALAADFVVADFFRTREGGRPGSYLLTRTN